MRTGYRPNRPHHFSSQIISKISQNICEFLSTAVPCRYDSNLYFYKLQPAEILAVIDVIKSENSTLILCVAPP